MINESDIILKYVMLSLIPGLGPITQNRLLNLFGDIERSFIIEENVLQDLDKLQPSNRIGKQKISVFVQYRNNPIIAEKAEETIQRCNELGISIITRKSAKFPHRFIGAEESPIVLYTKGDLSINKYDSSVGIVGARRCTTEGKDKAIEVSIKGINDGSAIISGMAKGIDSYAHTAAIKNNGYTIAVLGNGPDICYPEEHYKLYDEIIKHGCILSEYPPGTIPRKYTFPRRNRLIALLSDELFVIDAGRNSGTRSTVSFSKKYGKKVINTPVF